MAWTPIPPILATTSVTLDIMAMQHLTLWFGSGGVQHYLDYGLPFVCGVFVLRK